MFNHTFARVSVLALMFALVLAFNPLPMFAQANPVDNFAVAPTPVVTPANNVTAWIIAAAIVLAAIILALALFFRRREEPAPVVVPPPAPVPHPERDDVRRIVPREEQRREAEPAPAQPAAPERDNVRVGRQPEEPAPVLPRREVEPEPAPLPAAPVRPAPGPPVRPAAPTRNDMADPVIVRPRVRLHVHDRDVHVRPDVEQVVPPAPMPGRAEEPIRPPQPVAPPPVREVEVRPEVEVVRHDEPAPVEPPAAPAPEHAPVVEEPAPAPVPAPPVAGAVLFADLLPEQRREIGRVVLRAAGLETFTDQEADNTAEELISQEAGDPTKTRGVLESMGGREALDMFDRYVDENVHHRPNARGGDTIRIHRGLVVLFSLLSLALLQRVAVAAPNSSVTRLSSITVAPGQNYDITAYGQWMADLAKVQAAFDRTLTGPDVTITVTSTAADHANLRVTVSPSARVNTNRALTFTFSDGTVRSYGANASMVHLYVGTREAIGAVDTAVERASGQIGQQFDQFKADVQKQIAATAPKVQPQVIESGRNAGHDPYAVKSLRMWRALAVSKLGANGETLYRQLVAGQISEDQFVSQLGLATMSDVNTAVGSLKADLGTVQSTLSGMEAKITSHPATASGTAGAYDDRALQARVNGLASQVSTFDGRIGKVEESVNTLGTRVDSAEAVNESVVFALASKGTVKIQTADGKTIKTDDKDRRCEALRIFNERYPDRAQSSKYCKIGLEK